MHENEKNPRQELPEEQPEMLPEELESFDLDEIMREFAAPEQMDDATLQIPQDALAQDAEYITWDLTLNLVYENGQWWIMPEQSLLHAISAGILK